MTIQIIERRNESKQEGEIIIRCTDYDLARLNRTQLFNLRLQIDVLRDIIAELPKG